MRTGNYVAFAVILLAGALKGGTLIAQQAPVSPAHIHIGYVMTRWKETPNAQGLLPMARWDAKIAATHAGLAGKAPDSLYLMRLHSGHVLNALDTSIEPRGPASGFGVRKAAAGALEHIDLAAKADGASANVKTHATHVSASLNNVLQWTDQATAIAKKIRAATTAPEAASLVGELATLTRTISNGVDVDKDGQIGWQAGEGGLPQAIAHMGLMMKGEGIPLLP